MRSEIDDTTRLPPPRAAAHGKERERRRGEREERERGAARREKEKRRRGKRERERRLGLLISGSSMQGFASKFLMRGWKGGSLLL